IVVLITGCEQFGSSLITNTMTNPTAMSTAEYDKAYMSEENDTGKVIMWNDKRDKNPSYGNKEFDDSSFDDYDDVTETTTGYRNSVGNVVESATYKNNEDEIVNPSQRVK
ncbi:MAG: hypothetical protein MJ210_01185, partial [Alphaproteobacteria bacterium]|nr:hypothetical protein [Alphaproteobacteria bacterium]